MRTLAPATPLYASWDIGTFLENATKRVQDWGGLLIILLGAALVVWAVVKIFMNLVSDQQPHHWARCIIMLIIGGALMFGGATLVFDIAKGGKTTIEELGNATIPAQTIR